MQQLGRARILYGSRYNRIMTSARAVQEHAAKLQAAKLELEAQAGAAPTTPHTACRTPASGAGYPGRRQQHRPELPAARRGGRPHPSITWDTPPLEASSPDAGHLHPAARRRLAGDRFARGQRDAAPWGVKHGMAPAEARAAEHGMPPVRGAEYGMEAAGNGSSDDEDALVITAEAEEGDGHACWGAMDAAGHGASNVGSGTGKHVSGRDRHAGGPTDVWAAAGVVPACEMRKSASARIWGGFGMRPRPSTSSTGNPREVAG